MIIEFDDELADEILVANIAQTYVRLEESLKEPQYWHEDDIAHWKELLPAMKMVGEWYSTDFNEAIKQAKRRSK